MFASKVTKLQMKNAVSSTLLTRALGRGVGVAGFFKAWVYLNMGRMPNRRT
jgi:hypothetical protein